MRAGAVAEGCCRRSCAADPRAPPTCPAGGVEERAVGGLTGGTGDQE